MELFFGTTNPGKLRELRRLVAGLPIRVVSPEDLGRPLPEVVEDGHTFAENAAKKA
ncbi:MAG TPA: non-canonical purine NTP pyrophosphatase, partial [Anaeromyxobacter sp.]